MLYYSRHLEGPLRSGTSRGKIRLLLGARQTGKTALLRALTSGVRSRLFDLQDGDLRRRLEADPGLFSREVKTLPRGVRTVVVDEIQKVPALLDELQALHDSGRTLQVFVTGSSARQLRTRAANLLPGRSHLYRLAPVCGWEVARDEACSIPAPRSRSRLPTPTPFPLRDLGHALRFGALPGVQPETPARAAATLHSYVATYLEEEIRREALVRNMGPFLVFLRLAALESGQVVNLTKLSQASGAPVSTLKTYYQVLVDTFVGFFTEAYGKSPRKRLLTTPRFTFFDLGVRNAAAQVPFDLGYIEASGGPLLEQWVGQELHARATYLSAGHRVSFWRTAAGAEVDFIWESPREDVPIEVKWTARPRREDARHVEAFLDEHPARARRGFVVCQCPEPQALSERVVALPWARL